MIQISCVFIDLYFHDVLKWNRMIILKNVEVIIEG